MFGAAKMESFLVLACGLNGEDSQGQAKDLVLKLRPQWEPEDVVEKVNYVKGAIPELSS